MARTDRRLHVVNMQRATMADVAARAGAAFAPSTRVRIGAEVEWLVFDRDDPTRRIDAADVARIASGQLPAGGTVTIEPGGQVELVTPPHDGPRRLIDAIDTDTLVLAQRFDKHHLALVPLGLDPIRDPVRTLDVGRYAAMENYFMKVSPAGVRMMNSTASLQLNIDFGAEPARTWHRAGVAAPLLAAAFANSPTTDGIEFGPTSHRMGVWAATDPTRTRPVGPDTADWARYVLDAQVMPAQLSDRWGTEVDPLPFHLWLDHAEPPTIDDLDRHITTLFPPVRPRRYLEFRMLDALPARGRTAAIATVWALMTNRDVGELALEAAQPLADPWPLVRNEGLANSSLRTAATALLDATAGWARSNDARISDAVASWRERSPATHPADVSNWLLDTAEPAEWSEPAIRGDLVD